MSAEPDIGTTAGHVGCDGHGALLAGFRDDLGFHLMELGIQHLVRNVALAKHHGDGLGSLDGDGTYQNGLSLRMCLGNCVGNGI